MDKVFTVLIAQISPVFLFKALYTLPKPPRPRSSPNCCNVLAQRIEEKETRYVVVWRDLHLRQNRESYFLSDHPYLSAFTWFQLCFSDSVFNSTPVSVVQQPWPLVASHHGWELIPLISRDLTSCQLSSNSSPNGRNSSTCVSSHIPPILCSS